MVSTSRRIIVSKRRRFPVDGKQFPLAGIKDSFKNIFLLDGKTGFADKNWVKMKVISFHLPGNPFSPSRNVLL